MSLYKRDKTYWISFITPTGERIRQSTGTSNKILAQEFHDRLKTEYWQVSKLKCKPRRAWQEAVERWLTEVREKASIETDIMHLRYLDRSLRAKGVRRTRRVVRDRVRFF